MTTETSTWADQQASIAAAPDLTEPQFNAAYRLARAYGHEWAWVEGVGALRNVAAIHAATVAVEGYASPGGITGPEPGEASTVVHTTGSGRLTWEIHPSGDVFFTVSRPGDAVAINCRITTDVETLPAVTVADLDGSPFGDRHIDALLVAVDALLGRGHYSPTAIVRQAMALPGYNPVLPEAQGECPTCGQPRPFSARECGDCTLAATDEMFARQQGGPVTYEDGQWVQRYWPEDRPAMGDFSDITEAVFTPEDE